MRHAILIGGTTSPLRPETWPDCASATVCSADPEHKAGERRRIGVWKRPDVHILPIAHAKNLHWNSACPQRADVALRRRYPTLGGDVVLTARVDANTERYIVGSQYAACLQCGRLPIEFPPRVHQERV